MHNLGQTVYTVTNMHIFLLSETELKGKGCVLEKNDNVILQSQLQVFKSQSNLIHIRTMQTNTHMYHQNTQSI